MKTKGSEAKTESNEMRCWAENPQTQVLRVELNDGSFHLCPYAWLVWIQFLPKDETDTLTLMFNSRTVSIDGKNLRELALAFQRMNVELVKAQPQRRAPDLTKGIAFIQEIEIKENGSEIE